MSIRLFVPPLPGTPFRREGMPPARADASQRKRRAAVIAIAVGMTIAIAVGVAIAITIDLTMDRTRHAQGRRRRLAVGLTGGAATGGVVTAERGAHGDDDAWRGQSVLHSPEQPFHRQPRDRLLVDVDARRRRVHEAEQVALVVAADDVQPPSVDFNAGLFQQAVDAQGDAIDGDEDAGRAL